MKKEPPSLPIRTRILIVVLCILLIVSLVINGLLLSETISLGKQRSDLTADASALTTQNETLRTQLSDAQATAAAALQDADTVNADLQAEYTFYQEQAEATLSDVEQALSDLQAEYTVCQEQAEAALGDTEQALSNLQAEYTVCQEQAEAALGDAEQALTGLQAEFDTYQANADLALAVAIAAGEAAKQDAKDTAAQALATLQMEADTAMADADAAYISLCDEYTAYQSDAAAELADAVSAGEAAVQAAKDEASQSLAALQAAFDAYQTDAEATHLSLSDEYTAYQTDAQAAYLLLSEAFEAYITAAEATLATTRSLCQTEALQAQDAAAQEKAALQETYDAAIAAANEQLAAANNALALAQQQIAQPSIPLDNNGAGNQANGMLAYLYQGNIYYRNNYDNGSIYRENLLGYDDEFLRKTNTDPQSPLPTILGFYQDYMFYCSGNTLYRYSLTSNKTHTLSGQSTLSPISGIIEIHDMLYFLNYGYDKNGDPVNNLWRMEPDGKDLQCLVNTRASSFASDGIEIFYTKLDRPVLIRQGLDGRISSVLLYSPAATCLNMDGDTLYFSREGKLMKMNFSDYLLKAIPIGEARGRYLNVIGNWIYYANINDSGKLYRITTDGQYNEKLCDIKNVSNINIAGGWVYFMESETRDGRTYFTDTYKLRLDGSDLMLAKP